MTGHHIEFEPVTPAHYARLRHWLAQPHWRQWWGDPDEEFGLIKDMVEGRDSTRPYIFSLGGEPTGYIQCWFIGPHQTEEWARDNPWLMELSPETIGVDLSIGSAQQLSQGIGTAALKAFVRLLRNKGHNFIVIDPDPLNHRAVRAYVKAGFKSIPLLEGRHNGVLIMQHHNTEELSSP